MDQLAAAWSGSTCRALTWPAPILPSKYTEARTIAALLALLDRQGMQRATLISNSMGARTVRGSPRHIRTECPGWCWSRQTVCRALGSNRTRSRTWR